MAEPMTPYIVRQGDYLAKLAFVHGFDADQVWNDPKNDDLRKLRPNPNILAPGDILYIPESKKDELPIEKGADNNYSATVPKVEVTLMFQDIDGNPLGGEPCEILGLTSTGGENSPDKTEADGKLTLKVPVTLREVSVHFPQRNVTYTSRVGDMDPTSEASGHQKRLANLGFLPTDPETRLDDAELFSLAVRQFQVKNNIDPDGTLKGDTLDLLLRKHLL
jgi:hypothetical protein